MSTTLDAIEAQALQLPQQERQALIERLVASVVPAELSAAWQTDIERRLNDLNAGRSQAASADEVFARLDEKLRRAAG
jgi:putative addiction module component (TIGR02574 family)